MAEVKPFADQGLIARQISKIRQFSKLSQCLDLRKTPPGLSFQRLLRSLDSWEDKHEGRSEGWAQRGFNGIFVAGMHFMMRIATICAACAMHHPVRLHGRATDTIL